VQLIQEVSCHCQGNYIHLDFILVKIVPGDYAYRDSIKQIGQLLLGHGGSGRVVNSYSLLPACGVIESTIVILYFQFTNIGKEDQES